MKRIILFLLVLLLAVPATQARAATPYRTFTRGVSDNDLVQTQTAYEPVRSMVRFGEQTLKKPSDIHLGPDGNLYIADTGNKRILVVTKSGEFVKEVGDKKTLKSPKGVFVDPALNVYVADENARAVLVFSPEGELIRTYEKPTHPLFGEDSPYKPVKVALDKRGNLYVVSTGNTNGIIQISPVNDGEFLGYYGANQSVVSLLTAIQKAVLSDEQQSTMGSILPTSVQNICIDEKGMVYAVSQAKDSAFLRRLNVAGRNTLTPNWSAEDAAAVAVHTSGTIFAATASGTILEFTSEGNLLFAFGAFDSGEQRIGTFKAVTGLVVDQDYTIYVLDEVLGSVQVFTPTQFTDLVHSAFALFQDGKYAASKEPWMEALRMNSLFAYAYVGLGEALYREENYEEALDAFRNGHDREGYSNAFWELRADWLHQNLDSLIILAVGLMAALWIIRQLRRRTRCFALAERAIGRVGEIKLVRQSLYCVQNLKNPYDACYGIKWERKASYSSALVVLCGYFFWYMVNKYYSGFLFKEVSEGQYEIFRDFVTVFGVFALLTICCYLVCTIKEGEARFRDIFIGCAYALTPMLIFQPVLFGLTNVLSYNEEFFIHLIRFVSYGWTGLLVVINLMYLNDYSLKQTLRMIAWTLFTVLVSVALMFVLYVLICQLLEFVSSIYGEVVYRFVKGA